MRIEEAISQTKPFSNVYSKLVVNIHYTHNWLRYEQKKFFDQYGVTMKQYNILRILKGATTPLSTAEIRKRMLDNQCDASRLVDRMVAKNLLTKKSAEKDQRKLKVELTENALEILNALNKELDDWTHTVTGLDKHEAESLSNLLDKLRN